jgi:hypothetical protein
VVADKPWKLEAVLALGAGLMASLSLGLLASLGMHHFLPELPAADRKFYQFLISTICFQGVALALTHWLLQQHGVTWAMFLGLDQPRRWRALCLGLATGTLALPLALALNKLAELLITWTHKAPELQPTLQVLEVSLGPARRICFALAAIVVAPVVEEILFRGILYRAVRELGFPRTALYGSSLLFAAIHGSLMTLTPLFLLAIVLALLFDRAGSLLAPIAAHALFNAVNFFMFLLR